MKLVYMMFKTLQNETKELALNFHHY